MPPVFAMEPVLKLARHNMFGGNNHETARCHFDKYWALSYNIVILWYFSNNKHCCMTMVQAGLPLGPLNPLKFITLVPNVPKSQKVIPKVPISV